MLLLLPLLLFPQERPLVTAEIAMVHVDVEVEQAALVMEIPSPL